MSQPQGAKRHCSCQLLACRPKGVPGVRSLIPSIEQQAAFCPSRPVSVKCVGARDLNLVPRAPLNNISRARGTWLHRQSQVSFSTPTRMSSTSPTFAGYCREWALEATNTKAQFHLVPKVGKASCIMMSLHCHNESSKRPSFALYLLSAVRTAMMEEAVGLVAGISMARVDDEELVMSKEHTPSSNKRSATLCSHCLLPKAVVGPRSYSGRLDRRVRFVETSGSQKE